MSILSRSEYRERWSAMRTTIHFACVFSIVFAMHVNANCTEVQTYPGVAISPEWAFPANGSDAFAIDLSFTTVSRNSVAGCGVSFGKSEYKSLYGVQVALLNAYVQNDMYGLQFGATMFAERGAGLQVGLLTWCDDGDYLAQIGLVNGLNVNGFMNDAGASCYATSSSAIQMGLINLTDHAGMQIGVLNLGGARCQIGIFNFGNSGQIGVFNFGRGLKIGALNYNGDWLTPVFGWYGSGK